MKYIINKKCVYTQKNKKYNWLIYLSKLWYYQKMCAHTKKVNGEHGMEIPRDLYLTKLKNKKNNKLIKIITGLRRSGK